MVSACFSRLSQDLATIALPFDLDFHIYYVSSTVYDFQPLFFSYFLPVYFSPERLPASPSAPPTSTAFSLSVDYPSLRAPS